MRVNVKYNVIQLPRFIRVSSLVGHTCGPQADLDCSFLALLSLFSRSSLVLFSLFSRSSLVLFSLFSRSSLALFSLFSRSSLALFSLATSPYSSCRNAVRLLSAEGASSPVGSDWLSAEGASSPVGCDWLSAEGASSPVGCEWLSAEGASSSVECDWLSAEGASSPVGRVLMVAPQKQTNKQKSFTEGLLVVPPLRLTTLSITNKSGQSSAFVT